MILALLHRVRLSVRDAVARPGEIRVKGPRVFQKAAYDWKGKKEKTSHRAGKKLRRCCGNMVGYLGSSST